MKDIPVWGGAYFSEDGLYRYTLRRTFLIGKGTVAFVCLNPSTADEAANDPTVRRCIGYALKWGYNALYVLNLFGYRSTDPDALTAVSDPVGPENDDTFRVILPLCSKVVCGWGVRGVLHDRNLRAVELIKKAGHVPYAVRVTKDGHPQHPLYLPGDATAARYECPVPG